MTTTAAREHAAMRFGARYVAELLGDSPMRALASQYLASLGRGDDITPTVQDRAAVTLGATACIEHIVAHRRERPTQLGDTMRINRIRQRVTGFEWEDQINE